jgi:Zn-dependent alcohol dehydrogenase
VSVTARAAILRRFGGEQEIAEIALRDPLEGEVLVAISAAGVCHSDVGQADGEWEFPLPAVLGHEGAGIVEAVGPGVSSVSPGDRVLLSLAPGCGVCRHCLAARPILCQEALAAMGEGRLITGPSPIDEGGEPVAAYSLLACFAERVVVAERSVIPIPPDVPMEVAAVIGCAVITGVGAAIETLRPAPGTRGLVIGAGGVGVNALLGARVAGAAEVVVVDPAPARREIALSFGASHTSDSRDGTAAARLREDASREGFDWSIVTVGRPDAITLGIQAIRPGGTACIVGLAPQGALVPVDMLDLVTYERSIVGSAYGTITPQLLIPRILDLYRAGVLPLERLISDRFGLAQINDAFALSREAGGLRSVLHIAAESPGPKPGPRRAELRQPTEQEELS